jgi:phosphatidylglycerol:prolipoprotein diacylglycerol transferase
MLAATSPRRVRRSQGDYQVVGSIADLLCSHYHHMRSIEAIAIPYASVRFELGGIQIYGCMMLLALVAAILTAVFTRRRFELRNNDIAILVPVAIAAAIVFGHVFDVIVYQWDAISERPGLWFHVIDGTSLFGALFGVALVAVTLGVARRLALASLADHVVLACVIAMTIGRIGCALVHDHPGLPTDSALGVDFPAERVGWLLGNVRGPTVRLHDVGLEELLALLPIAAGAIVLATRRGRPGTLAIFVTLAYAVVRFGLDTLRLPEVEPRHAMLTAGQWSCLVLALLAILAFVRRGRQPTATASGR